MPTNAIRSTLLGAPRYLFMPGLVGNYPSAPDAAYWPTGNIDIRLDFASTDWTPSAIKILCDKWGAAGQRSWTFRLNTDGTLSFFTSADGTASSSGTSSVPVPAADYNRICIGVRRNSGTGAMTFWRAPSFDGVWTQLGASTANTAGAIFDSTTSVTLGTDGADSGNRLSGNFYRAQIRSNILDDGTGIVFDPDFAAQPVGTLSFRESSDNKAVVTVNQTGANYARITAA